MHILLMSIVCYAYQQLQYVIKIVNCLNHDVILNKLKQIYSKCRDEIWYFKTPHLKWRYSLIIFYSVTKWNVSTYFRSFNLVLNKLEQIVSQYLPKILTSWGVKPNIYQCILMTSYLKLFYAFFLFPVNYSQNTKTCY